MKSLKIVSLVLISTFCLINISGAVVLTFDDLEQSGSGYSTLQSYSSDHFEFNSSISDSQAFAAWQQSHPNYNTSASLFNNQNNGLTTLSMDSDNLFTINSIDIDLLGTSGSANVHFYAFNASGTEVGNLSYDLNVDGWFTVNFDSSFANIASFQFQQITGYWHQFDNVVLNETAPVPEPATLFLLGSGLIGLAGWGWKNSKKLVNPL